MLQVKGFKLDEANMLEINGVYDLIASQSKSVFTESVYKIDPNS